MFDTDKFSNEIFGSAAWPFEERALELFRFQAGHNPLYKDFIRHLGVAPDTVNRWEDIPCLPVSFFKTHEVRTGSFTPALTFTSSSTTGTGISRHLVADPDLYRRSFGTAFRKLVGDPEAFVIAALLPSYTGRPGSSLIYMVNELIHDSQHPESGYLTYGPEMGKHLVHLLTTAQHNGRTLLLIGVSFALLDLAKQAGLTLPGAWILETGGMKGRGKELTREELHTELHRLQPARILSEYGMTELLSQAYTHSHNFFVSPPWMRVTVSDVNDPLTRLGHGRTGTLNVVDLANVHSCAFIATADLGMVSNEGFSVLGRLDNSDIRGCNLLYVS